MFLTKKKIDKNAKKTMNQRLISSIFMAIYIILLFVFAILCDNTNEWSSIPASNLIGRRICAFIFLFLPLPLVFIIAKEITNIYFKFNWYAYFWIAISMLCLIYIPTILYFLEYYNFSNIFDKDKTNITGLNLTNTFTIALFSNIALTIIIVTLLLWKYKCLNFKNWIIFSLLIGISSGFFIGLYFFTFVRAWTTLLFLMLIVIMMDSFAYFGGVLFGKHKMSPIISPKKTWEGFIIAIILTTLLSVVLLVGYAFVDNKQTLCNILGVTFTKSNENFSNNIIASKPLWWFNIVVIIIGLSIISVLGDLCFSWFKRKYRIKDYGVLIPGHGGVLDRIDSHSFVLSSFFVFTFFLSLFSKTAVFFENI